MLPSAFTPFCALYLGAVLPIAFCVSRRKAGRSEAIEEARMTGLALRQLARRLMLDTFRLEQGAGGPLEHRCSRAFERELKKPLRRGRHPVWNKALHV